MSEIYFCFGFFFRNKFDQQFRQIKYKIEEE